MLHDLLPHYDRLVREALARGLGCEVAAFASETLTIVARVEPPRWDYVAWVMTFGTGTVLSAHPDYLDWTTANAPALHFEAFYPPFMLPLVEEGARRGEALRYSTPELAFTLGSDPPNLPVPDGLSLEMVDQAWMAAEQPRRRFEHGVGEEGQEERDARNRFAAVLFDGAEPVAVAGAFDTYGLFEIGIDVVRGQRGRGLAPVVTAAVTREILRRDGTPYYMCDPTNIRSHRNAEAVGFAAISSSATVSRRTATE